MADGYLRELLSSSSSFYYNPLAGLTLIVTQEKAHKIMHQARVRIYSLMYLVACLFFPISKLKNQSVDVCMLLAYALYLIIPLAWNIVL